MYIGSSDSSNQDQMKHLQNLSSCSIWIRRNPPFLLLRVLKETSTLCEASIHLNVIRSYIRPAGTRAHQKRRRRFQPHVAEQTLLNSPAVGSILENLLFFPPFFNFATSRCAMSCSPATPAAIVRLCFMVLACQNSHNTGGSRYFPVVGRRGQRGHLCRLKHSSKSTLSQIYDNKVSLHTHFI